MPALMTEQSYTTAFAEGKASSDAIPLGMTSTLQPLDTLLHQALDTTSADKADPQSADNTRGHWMTPKDIAQENELLLRLQHANTAPDPELIVL